jgi:hypothetical protein
MLLLQPLVYNNSVHGLKVITLKANHFWKQDKSAEARCGLLLEGFAVK